MQDHVVLFDFGLAAAAGAGLAGLALAKRREEHGNSRGSRANVRRLARRLQKPEPGGALILPNDLGIPGPSQQNPAVAVLGPSGSGKSHLLATLIATWPGPVFFTTTKPDLAIFAARAKTLLHQWTGNPNPPAAIFDPGGLLGAHPARCDWDPAMVPSSADPHLHAREQARVMAEELRGNANAFWALRSEVILTALLALGAQGNLLGLVAALAQAGPKQLVTLLAEGATKLEQAGDMESAATLTGIKDSLVTESTARRAFDELATAMAALQPLLRVRGRGGVNSGLPRLDLGGWAQSQAVAGIVVPPELGQSLGPLVAALVQDAIAALRATQRVRPWAALIVLDEAPNIAHLPNVPTWATELRGWDAYLILAAQSSEQFRKWNNAAPVPFITHHFPLTLVAQGAAEHELAKLVSERHGTHIVTHNKATEKEWRERRPVLAPEHVFGDSMGPGRWAAIAHGRLVRTWTLEPVDVLLARLEAAVQRQERRTALRAERASMRGTGRSGLKQGAAP
jgi:type IV secretory pathway TraG/TraD family ATPase VirD4